MDRKECFRWILLLGVLLASRRYTPGISSRKGAQSQRIELHGFCSLALPKRLGVLSLENQHAKSQRISQPFREVIAGH